MVNCQEQCMTWKCSVSELCSTTQPYQTTGRLGPGRGHECPSTEILNWVAEDGNTVTLHGSSHIHHPQQTWSHWEKTAGQPMNTLKRSIVKVGVHTHAHRLNTPLNQGKPLSHGRRRPAQHRGSRFIIADTACFIQTSSCELASNLLMKSKKFCSSHALLR